MLPRCGKSGRISELFLFFYDIQEVLRLHAVAVSGGRGRIRVLPFALVFSKNHIFKKPVTYVLVVYFLFINVKPISTFIEKVKEIISVLLLRLYGGYYISYCRNFLFFRRKERSMNKTELVAAVAEKSGFPKPLSNCDTINITKLQSMFFSSA